MAHCEVLRFLAGKYRAAVQHRGPRGRLPLHILSDSCNVDREKVQLLIDLYPEAVMVTDDVGMLPIHVACHRDWTRDIVQLLVNSHDGGEDGHNGLLVIDNRGRSRKLWR